MKGIKYIGPVLDFCYDDKTEVLTDSGWLFFEDLQGHELFASLDSTGSLCYHPANKLEPLKFKWDDDLLHFKSLRSGIDLLVTPNHQMYVQTEKSRKKDKSFGWRLERAKDVFGAHRIYKRNADFYEFQGVKYINVAGRKVRTEDWLKFLGYYLSEGSATITKRKDYIVQIRQYGDKLQEMACALDIISTGKINIRSDGRVIVNDKDLAIYLKNTFGYTHEKFIPRNILNKCSRDQLRILFDALMDGDGSSKEEGGDYYTTSSIRLRDDFQELLLKVGLSGSYTLAKPKGSKAYFKKEDRYIMARKDIWKVFVRRKSHEVALSGRSSYKSMYEKVPYSGHVYCVTVPNSVLYVRRNGHTVWSGNSGYGEAARNYILSLNKKGIPITVFPRNFDPSPPPIADKEQRETLDSLIDKDIPYDVVIIHLTPDLYPRYIEKNKYNIGFMAWETSLLHPRWSSACGVVDEMWVPCQWNLEALKNSGVNKPMFKIPHGIDPGLFDSLGDKEFNIKGLSPSTYKFYSIFQWMHRKNPEGLLRAYFNAFDETDDVALILKTYRMGMSRDKEFIRSQIIDIKKDMGIGGYPKVILIGDLLSKTQMLGLHLYGDCCVGLSRGEGWYLPAFESGVAGNPVIATRGGGHLEFMNDDNSFLIDATEVFVSGMSSFNQWYLGNQQWYECSDIKASETMQYVFYNREEAAKKGSFLKESIIENFSWDKVSDIIEKRLFSI